LPKAGDSRPHRSPARDTGVVVPLQRHQWTRTGNGTMTPPDRIDTFGSRFAHDAGVWLIVTACLFILLGLFAVIEPIVAGLAISLLVGWLLIAGGATHIISIFRRDDGGAVWHLALGLVYISGGVYFLSHPVIALEALTLLLAMLLFVEAGIDLVAYSAQRREPGAVWLLVNAFVTALLGTLIAMHWPSMTVWVIGTMLGLNMLTTGFSRLMLGLAARNVAA
jgi:uncharacterized membrane protein HdeD (DUF308 family)